MAATGLRTEHNSRRVSLLKQLPYFMMHGLLILLAAAFLLPYAFALSGSLKREIDIFAVPIKWIPAVPEWHNYVVPFTKGFQWYFTNSLLVACIDTISPLILCSLAGYSLAKFHYPGRQLVFLFILSTIMLPSQVLLIPTFIIIRQLNWVDTFMGLIVPNLASTIGVFLMRQFLQGIPDEYIDAARIDGASEIGIFARIIVPMSRPALSALAIFSFTGAWNSFLWPLIIVSSDKLRTIPLGIVRFLGEERVPAFGPLLAAAMTATLPVWIVFVIMQKEFIRGAVMSGIKG